MVKTFYKKLYDALKKCNVSAGNAFEIANNPKFIEDELHKLMNFFDGNCTPDYLTKYYNSWKRHDSKPREK